MSFLDGESLPTIASGDEILVWTFASGRANAMLAVGLSSQRLRVRATDNFSIAVATSDGDEVTGTPQAIEPAGLHVPISDRLLNELKYEVCLPDDRARAVLRARVAAREIVEKLLRKPRGVVRRGA